MKESKKKEVPAEVRAEITAAMRAATDLTRMKTYRRLLDEVDEMDRDLEERFTNGKGLNAEERIAYMEALTPFRLRRELLRRLIAIETVRLHTHTFRRIWQVFDAANEPDTDKVHEVLADILSADKLRDKEINNTEKNTYAAAWGM